jgi:hypothetical protein
VGPVPVETDEKNGRKLLRLVGLSRSAGKVVKKTITAAVSFSYAQLLS